MTSRADFDTDTDPNAGTPDHRGRGLGFVNARRRDRLLRMGYLSRLASQNMRTTDQSRRMVVHDINTTPRT